MAANTTDLPTLFADLQKQYQRGEYEKALKVANRILHEKSSDDVKAIHCKIVCLVQLGKFEEGLTLIRKNPAVASAVGFEKAYCEYRLNRNNDALKTLNGIENRSAAANELLAQVLYRMEDLEECYRIYREQLKNTSDDYEAERETNLSAVLASLQTWGDSNVHEFGLSEDSYEVAYNSACFLLGKELYEEALEKLKEAERKCVEFFEDDADATDEDVEAELGIIRAQMGYACQKLGRNEQAMKLYNQVVKQKPSDMALLAVVSNNIVSLNKDQNVFDSKKKIKSATVPGLQNKLVSHQREVIAMNQCLLYMYSNQGEQCRQTAEQLQKTYPSNDLPSLIAAAQYVKDKEQGKAVETLKAQIAKSAGTAVTLKLTLAQLYLAQGLVYQACDVLKSLGDYSYKPGVISALVSLYVSQEDMAAASDVLSKTVHWFAENDPNSPESVQIMKATVDFEMTHGQPEAATALLETLRKKDPSDLKILAQLISAYSKFDPQKAEAVSRELPSPIDLTKGIDAVALEASVASFMPRYVKKSALTKGEQSPSSPKSGGGDEPLKKHRKKKKGKLPKNCEPGSTPDPERWLPLRERSTFKGRRRKNKRDVGKGTQGTAGASALMAELDISKPGGEASSPRPGTSASQPPQTSGPRQHKPQGAKPKKKKKGPKW